MDIGKELEKAYKDGYEQGKKDAVRHGKWVSSTNANGDRIYYCSRCCYEPPYENDVYKECEYCQKCGAKMIDGMDGD